MACDCGAGLCATGWHLRSATLHPACEEGSCMDPARLPHAPYSLAADSQTAYGKSQ